MKTDTTDFEGEDFMHLKFPILQDGSKYAVFFNATETIIDEMTLDEKKANTKLLGEFDNPEDTAVFWDDKTMEYFS